MENDIMNAKEKTKDHFDKTASDYNNSSDGKFVEGMYDVLVTEILKSGSGRVLDVGCGNGNLFKLLPDGKYELHGIDFSKNMIDEAKRTCKTQATFAVADAESLPFDDNSFDIIVCNASFHQTPRLYMPAKRRAHGYRTPQTPSAPRGLSWLSPN